MFAHVHFSHEGLNNDYIILSFLLLLLAGILCPSNVYPSKRINVWFYTFIYQLFKIMSGALEISKVTNYVNIIWNHIFLHT